jgi:putative ABC transport system substrate-binding protein
VEASAVDVRDPGEIERAVAVFAGQPNGGLIVTASSPAFTNRNLIMALAARYRLLAIYPNRAYVAGAGLISYGSDRLDEYRRTAGTLIAS